MSGAEKRPGAAGPQMIPACGGQRIPDLELEPLPPEPAKADPAEREPEPEEEQ